MNRCRKPLPQSDQLIRLLLVLAGGAFLVSAARMPEPSESLMGVALVVFLACAILAAAGGMEFGRSD